MPWFGSSAWASQVASRAISSGANADCGALDIWPLSLALGRSPRELRVMREQISGGCACGRVRYLASIDDHDAYLCHCRMCQRATGSISIAFKNVKQQEVRWDQEPDWFGSSPIAERPY